MTLYSEEHEIFRRTFKRFVENELVPQIEEWEEKGGVSRTVWKRFGELGYLCPWLDEQYGGAGAGFEYSAIIDEELARASISIGIELHNDIASPYIASYGTEEQKKRLLPGFASGDIISAIAMTEPNAGSDLQGVKTTAVKDGQHYVLNGQKTFITNGIIADIVIVVCKTDPQAIPPHKGISLIMVEDGTPGFVKGRRLKKMGMHSQETAELFFDNCRVPATNLIGQECEGFTYLMQKLQQERLVVCLSSLAMAERMLADTISYAKSREAFRRPIGQFQHNAFKIAEMATEVEIGRVFLDKLLADHIDGREIVTRVSMGKWWLAEMANKVAYHCLQLHGGYGYMDEYPISRHFRNVRVQSIYGGTTEIMKLIIARKLGF